MYRSKKYKDAAALIQGEAYSIDEAVELISKTSVTKFDASCEVHANLGVDPKQADQNIRTTATLPNGTGKTIKVVAFTGEENIKAAKDAGADWAGTSDLIAKIEGGWSDFDVAVATPDQMRDLAKIAKILGQKGLMPSPKSGTVTPDFVKAIDELKKGRIEIRVDKQGNVHSLFGKVSFSADNLKENLKVFVKTLMDIKPSSSKGIYLRSLTITTAMGPGIRLDTNQAIADSK